MASAQRYREMTAEQLQHELLQARRQLMDRVVRSSASSDDDGPSRATLKRDVARIRTILAEKAIGTAPGSVE